MDHATESSMSTFDRMAELIAEKWYGGKLPPYPAVIVQLLLKTIPDDADLRKVSAEVLALAKKSFADCLSAALSDRIAAQDAAANRQFQN
jgi:hypothetical protein